MAWGARQHDDGTWRLCERKGRTVLHVNKAEWPDVEIRFKSQAKAKACVGRLNELYWKPYHKAQTTQNAPDWPSFGWEMLSIIHQMGGLSNDDYERILK